MLMRPPAPRWPRFIELFTALGFIPAYAPATLLPIVATVCLVCTLIESLPVNALVDDNFSVPAAAVAVSMLLLPLAAAATAGGYVGSTFSAAAPAVPLALLQ